MRLVVPYMISLDVLHPDYHSRGIMTAVVQAMIKEVWVPYLKARYIAGDAFVDNLGSQKVFLKSGFTFVGYGKALVDASSKGRTDRRLAEFEWNWSGIGDEDK